MASNVSLPKIKTNLIYFGPVYFVSFTSVAHSKKSLILASVNNHISSAYFKEFLELHNPSPFPPSLLSPPSP